MQSILRGVQSILKGINILRHFFMPELCTIFCFVQFFPSIVHKKTWNAKFGEETSKLDHILPKLTAVIWWKEIEFW